MSETAEERIDRYLVGDIKAETRELLTYFGHFICHNDVEHVVLGEALLHAVRNFGIHTVVLPFDRPPHGFPYGAAHVSHKEGVVASRHIEVFIAPASEMFFHVLLHEWVHHVMGHCDVYDSRPVFGTEYETELKVLEIAKHLVSLPLYEKMVKWAKENVYQHYARYAYFDEWGHHLSLEIADWCGYHTDDKIRRELIEGEA